MKPIDKPPYKSTGIDYILAVVAIIAIASLIYEAIKDAGVFS